MNSLSTAAKNTLLDAWAAVYDTASLHSAFPGDTGANEIAGGGYARQAITWNVAAGGSLDNNSNPSFSVEGGDTIAWLGFWDAPGGVNWGGWAAIAGGVHTPFTATNAGDLFTADNHGYVDGMRVFLMDTTGAVIPTGVTEGVIYFVVSATTDTFQLALTLAGAPIVLSTDGAGFVASLVPETFGSNGTYTTTDVDIDLLR